MVEVRGRRKSGETFPLEMSLSAIELPDGIGFLGAIRDVTERQRLQGRIVQAEKLASLGVLSAGLAHEINNPLAYVTSNLAVLERDFGALGAGAGGVRRGRADHWRPPNPSWPNGSPRSPRRTTCRTSRRTWARSSKSTRQGARRVSDIVQNLREFARLDQAAIDRFDLNAAIARCLELIRGRMEQHQIDVVLNLGEIPPIVCAPAQINQVILNLLLNAQQAIEETRRNQRSN